MLAVVVFLMKILVVRNDKIGDFVLALPAFKAIKEAFPQATVTALVPSYTKEIAGACEWIDDVLIDPKDNEAKSDFAQTISTLHFDAALCLFSNAYNATLLRKARIPVRVAPATKWVQFLYTHTLRQRRSKSEKAEFQYNLDLAYYFIDVLKGSSRVIEPHRLLEFSQVELEQQKAKLMQIGIQFDRKTCFVHPVTGGSSNTLSQTEWQSLICFLDGLDRFHFVVTAGPGEGEVSKALVDSLIGKVASITLYDKNDGVKDFMRSIAVADLFIAGSTGPLHIAGALDVPTIGFYPKKRSSTPLRWQTLNSAGRWLSFIPNEEQDDLSQLTVKDRFSDIQNWYTQNIGK